MDNLMGDEEEEEVLAVLKAHTGSVNVVRFSPNGKVWQVVLMTTQ